ncbi:MAG: DUF2520 domain-containing protein [Hylemonella sp.]|nr:DUF2520 domain-containing protein [Hylemonella sp.]MDP1937812.1 DUF2520 domain-containing protein [Hylemonella sp.]
MKTLNLIGCGRVGRTLGRLWQQHQTLQIQDVLTTSPESAQAAVDFMGAGHAVASLAQMRPADFWLIAVPDRQILESARVMAQTLAGMPPAMAFHASGALGSAVLAPLRERGWHVGSAHCILSFATPAAAVQQFAGTPCGLEGDAAALHELRSVFTAIGAECFAVEADKKVLYHAAAVFGTNFLPVLQALAEDLWRDSGVPTELLPRLRASLLRNAVDNVLALGPAGALTGPAARGDTALVQRQGQAVSDWDPTAGEAYRALSELARRLAREGKLRPD